MRSTPRLLRDRPQHRHGVLALLAVLALLEACTRAPVSRTGDEAGLPFQLGRTQTLRDGDVEVELAIPSDADVSAQFGISMAGHGIQPIWMRIRNDGPTNYWLLPIAIDADYYSANEVAQASRGHADAAEFAERAQSLRERALPFFQKAGGTTEGYVYASHVRGGRFVDVQLTPDVRLSGNRPPIRLRFAVLLPTEGFDYERSELRQRYAEVDALPDASLEQVHALLRDQPCCTTNADGSGEGDPLNVVLVGSGEAVVSALTASGWNFSEAITVDSIRRMVGAAIAEKSFLTAPVSSLYALGRKQDIALQRGRSTISQRNHMRLWLAPFRCEGEPVWIGQVSRDIGVKLTRKSPTLTTHMIDENVDESREYLLHSLLFHEAVEWFAFVRGVGPATIEQPRHNLTDDPYFTDGMRLVVRISRVPVPPEGVRNLGWNDSTDPIEAGKGLDSRVTPGVP